MKAPLNVRIVALQCAAQARTTVTHCTSERRANETPDPDRVVARAKVYEAYLMGSDPC